MSVILAIAVKGDEDADGAPEPYLCILTVRGATVVLELELTEESAAFEVGDEIVKRGAVISRPDLSELRAAGIVRDAPAPVH